MLHLIQISPIALAFVNFESLGYCVALSMWSYV